MIMTQLEDSSDKQGATEINIEPWPNIRITTNFKVEPGCFRGEKSRDLMNDTYEIGDVIGVGSYGEVRRIRSKTTGVIKALKIIEKINCQMTDNFADEIEIIKKLVAIFGIYRITQILFAFMSFIKMRIIII